MQVACKDAREVRIYRADRVGGAFEEVGVAREERFVDVADLIPGKTYYYVAVGFDRYPEQDALKDMEPVEAQVPRVPCEKRVDLAQKTEAFGVRMGGYVDESNAVLR